MAAKKWKEALQQPIFYFKYDYDDDDVMTQ